MHADTATQRVQGFDWAGTSLGPREQWPDALRAKAELILSLPVPAALCWGPAFTVCAYSEPFLPILGGAREILGQPWLEAWPEISEQHTPWLERIRQGESCFFDHQKVFYTRYTQVEEAYFSYGISPVKNDAGQVFGAVFAGQEITERVHTQAALNDSETRFKALVRASAWALWEADPQGNLIAASVPLETLTGLSEAELRGYKWMTAVHPEDRDHFRTHWDRARAQNSDLDVQFRIADARRGWVWCNARATPLLDTQGQAYRWTGMNIDIDEQKRAEQLLEEAVAQRDRFFSVLSHELRNPLAAITATVDLLAVDSNAQNQPSTLPILQRQLTHLHRLVDDLLDASRLQQRRLELRSDPLDLVEVIEAAIEDTRHVFAKAGPELKASLPSQPVCLSGDRVRLVQVFVNLLRNAAKFTPVGGRVTITIELDGESARVRIEDTGEGIPPDAIEHIFELFRQAQSSHSNAGFGIGLALAHEITTLHGGKIEARSAGVGCGATFEVHLPLDDQSESAVDHKPRTLQIDQFGHRVLLVEDQPDVAEAMGMLLETVVAKVHVATSAEQALALFPQLDVNVVITDIGLQDMSGMELAGRLLEAATHRPPSLIALSGWGDESTRRAAEQAGFKGFLRKPLDLEALRDLLSEIDVSAP